MTRNIGINKLHIIPLQYLKLGDRFVATQIAPRSNVTILAGVADMDGHEVSENYGFRVGNTYHREWSESSAGVHKNNGYINVRLDGIEYGSREFKVNETLYAADGWTIYVTRAIADRVKLDIARNESWPAFLETIKLENQKAELLAQVAVLQQKIEELT